MTKILARLHSKAGEAVRKTASTSVASLSRVVVKDGRSAKITVTAKKTQHGQEGTSGHPRQ